MRNSSPHSTSWYGLVHWLLYGFDDDLEKARLTGVWRFEAFRDNNGAATGVAIRTSRPPSA